MDDDNDGGRDLAVMVYWKELGGALSEGGVAASSSFPSITNRGLSNQEDLEIKNKVNVEDL